MEEKWANISAHKHTHMQGWGRPTTVPAALNLVFFFFHIFDSRVQIVCQVLLCVWPPYQIKNLATMQERIAILVWKYSRSFTIHFNLSRSVNLLKPYTLAWSIGTMQGRNKKGLESARTSCSCWQDASIEITDNTSCWAVGGGGYTYANQPVEWDSHSWHLTGIALTGLPISPVWQQLFVANVSWHHKAALSRMWTTDVGLVKRRARKIVFVRLEWIQA